MAVDLHKKAERAGITLKKQGIETPPRIRVGLMMDISGSMQHLYNDHVSDNDGWKGSTVQHAINHVLGLAMAFDPSHKLDVFVFDDQHAQLPKPATPENYSNYVKSQILTESEIPKWGGTRYAGVMHQFQDHYFGEHPDHQEHREPRKASGGFFNKLFHRDAVTTQAAIDPDWAKLPVLGLLFTDGDNGDHFAAERAIARSAPYPVFWSLVGIGDQSFRFLRQMDQEFPDAEFVDLEDIHLSDEELYAELVSPKLISWLKTHQS
jgi:hypothetical protein